MALQSKWQQLPTEAINPASLAIDKLSSAAIIDLMVDEDRKVVAAVFREKERIALGVESVNRALRKGGRLVISFFSDEELQTIYERIVGNE